MNTTTQPKNESLAQFLWTAFILLFFVLQAILWTFAISFTASDQSHAVVAGYDEQALKWDELRQASIDSEQLGWQIKINVEEPVDLRGNRELALSLTDRDGIPVTNADIAIRVFHFGEAANVQQFVLNEESSGVYRGTMECCKAGHWKFSGSARKDDTSFLFNEKIWLEGVR